MKTFFVLIFFIEYTRQALPGMKKSHNSNVAITPIQYPGILNPDIYVQNYQSSPVVPEAKIPSVKMNLHIDGLEKYYHPHPQIVHHRTVVHHRGKYDGLIDQLFKKTQKKKWKQYKTYYIKYKSLKSRKYG